MFWQPTGMVEIEAHNITILNSVNFSLPFRIGASEGDEEPREDIRMRYRVLDLRRKRMSDNLRLRHKVVRAIRNFLEDNYDFVEVETPMLAKPTPE
eukprot:gene15860-18810_t